MIVNEHSDYDPKCKSNLKATEEWKKCFPNSTAEMKGDVLICEPSKEIFAADKKDDETH